MTTSVFKYSISKPNMVNQSNYRKEFSEAPNLWKSNQKSHRSLQKWSWCRWDEWQSGRKQEEEHQKKQEAKPEASEMVKGTKLGHLISVTWIYTERQERMVKNRFRPCPRQDGHLILHKCPSARPLVRNLTWNLLLSITLGRGTYTMAEWSFPDNKYNLISKSIFFLTQNSTSLF